MKIVHIQLKSPYTDNWGYQENILPRCQVRMGDEVTFIAGNIYHVNTGEIVEGKIGQYTLDDGVKVIRIAPKKITPWNKFNIFLGFYKYLPILRELKPDMIFVHGLYTSIGSATQVVRYKKRYNKDCVIVADSHEWGYGLPDKLSLKQNFSKGLRVAVLKKVAPSYKCILCLAPKCMDFANEYYGISRDNMILFPLGFDPEECNINNKDEIRKKFRTEYGIDNDYIVIIHGGKIIPRRKTEEAIKVVKELNKYNSNIKLLIFGDISREIKDKVKRLISENSDFVIYLGHLKQCDYCKAYMASDIAFFPGAPSALWQEAIGCGLPLVICHGFESEFLNRGGNVEFCKQENTDDMFIKLRNMIDSGAYLKMSKIASQNARSFFSYENMAGQLQLLKEM